MKILYNPGRFNGGAPLSMLQYAKIAKENNYSVLAIGEYSTSQVNYHKNGIKTKEVPCFYMKRPFKNLVGLWSFYKIVKDERPNIIHATSYGIVPSKFINKLTGIPTIYSIAGGKNAGKNIVEGIFKNEEVIVYSLENKEDLVTYGYNENLINVISNRLEITNNDFSIKRYEELEYRNSIINLLMISRLDIGVVNSIEYVIDIVDKLAQSHPNIKLDIIGDGKIENRIQKKVKTVNTKYKKDIIILHGHTNNVKDFIFNADIVFGKGRSIIEAVLYKRVSFVVGEDRTITKCTPETIEHLYKYNFSGRKNIMIYTLDDVSKLLEKIKDNNLNSSELEETRDMVDKLYNIEHAIPKILKIYRRISIDMKSRRDNKLMPAFTFISGFFYKKIKSVILNKVKI